MFCTSNDRGQNTLAAEDLTLAQLARFDDIIDVRSPSEFRDDHIPGAVNFPVLNDEERAGRFPRWLTATLRITLRRKHLRDN